MFIGLNGENLLSLKVGGCRLGFVDLIDRARQHVLGDEQEVGILAGLDAASLILDEHLLGNVEGQGGEGLFAGQQFFGPPWGVVLAVKLPGHSKLHHAKRIVGTAACCRIVGVRAHGYAVVEI